MELLNQNKKNNIMKIYTEKQKDKKYQKNNHQKLSFLYLPTPTDLQIKQRVSQHLCDHHRNYDQKQYTTTKRKNTQDITLFPLNTSDTQSTKQFTPFEEHPSTQNLHFLPNSLLPTHLKITPTPIRQSQNIYTHQSIIKTPTHSCIDKNLPSNKSTFNFPSHPCVQINASKCNAQRQPIDGEENIECKEIQELIQKIYQIQVDNQKIKQENIKLRLIKLSTHSQSMSMLTLKLEIFDLKKKIEKLTSQHHHYQSQYQSLQNSIHDHLNNRNCKQQIENLQNLQNIQIYNSPPTHKQRAADNNQRNASIGKIANSTHSYHGGNSQSPNSNPTKKYNTQSPTFIRNKKDSDQLLNLSNKIE